MHFWPKLEAIENKEKLSSTLPSIIEMTDASPEEVLVTLQFIEKLHDQSLSIIHKFNLKSGDVVTLSFSGVVDNLQDRFTYLSGGRLPEELNLPNQTFKVFLELRDVSGRTEDKSTAGNSKNILVRQFLGKWALITLFILASITFPHENTSRYPDPNGRGSDNYTDALGIAKYVNHLGYILGMTLPYLDYVLERVSEFTHTAKRTE